MSITLGIFLVVITIMCATGMGQVWMKVVSFRCGINTISDVERGDISVLNDVT